MAFKMDLSAQAAALAASGYVPPAAPTATQLASMTGLDIRGTVGTPGGPAYGSAVPGPATGLLPFGIIDNSVGLLDAVQTGTVLSAPGGERSSAFNSPPSLRGAANKLNPWGAVPLILGTHYIAPPYAGKPYTEINGTLGVDQYLRFSFILGYGAMSVREFRVGENLLNLHPGGTIGVVSVTTGAFADLVSIQTVYGSAETMYYTGRVDEVQLDMQARWPDGATSAPVLYQPTPPNTTKIAVDIEFPSGLVEGDAGTAVVAVNCAYRISVGAAWVNIYSGDLSANAPGAVRFTKGTGDITEGAYEVCFSRETRDAAATSKVKDTTMWSALRCTLGAPATAVMHPTPDIRSQVTRMSMLVKADDRINGTIGEINCVCTSIVPVWDGAMSGAAGWVGTAESANPAALALYLLRTKDINPNTLADLNIDWPAFEALHKWCEGHDHAGTTLTSYCNAVIDSQMTLREALGKVLSTARAGLRMNGAQYSVFHDDYKGTIPVAVITPRNSWGFQGTRAFPDPIHGYRVQYVNKDSGYQKDERLVLDDGYLYYYSVSGVTALRNAFGSVCVAGETCPSAVSGEYALATKIQSIERWGITDTDMAFREGRYLLGVRRYRPEVYTVSQDFESIGYQVGDRVQLGHDVPLLGLSGGRVKAFDSGTGVLTSDEVLTFASDTTLYGIRYIDSAGVVGHANVASAVGSYFVATISSISHAANPSPGDIFWFGERTTETLDCIVVGIEPGADLSATITLQKYDEEICNYDARPGGLYDSVVTLPSAQNAQTFGQVWKAKTDAAIQAGLTISMGLGTYNSAIDGAFRVVGSSTYPGGSNYKCDGTADDVQIQAALDEMHALGGGTVLLTGGVFTTTSKVTVEASICLRGVGTGTEVVTTASIDMIELIGSGSKLDLLALTGEDDASYSVVVVSASGCSVTRCKIENKLEINETNCTQTGNTIIAGTT